MASSDLPPELVQPPEGEVAPDLVGPGRATLGPFALVGGAATLNLVDLRAETNYVPLLNDGSLHSAMVRAAARLISSGHLPLASWFPNLQLGSPQFLHYQSLGAMLTGLVGTVLGADRSYAWSLYLLVALWPIGLYLAARVFAFGRYTAACAAVCGAFLTSVPGVGYEHHAYLFSGFGVWSQLLAMWTLPFAWAYTFRAITSGRATLWAVVFISLTIGFHFEMGYLAIAPLVLFCFVAPSKFASRAPRALLIGVASFAATSWALVPLLQASKWAAINESLQHTYYTDSYGARQALSWLVGGNLTDAGRLPIITVLGAIGFCVSLRAARSDERARALLVLFVVSLLLFFGRTTFGSLIDIVPGSEDLFLRRFMIGVQLTMVLFAGIGATTAARFVQRVSVQQLTMGRDGFSRRGVLGFRFAAVALFVVFLTPAWTQLRSYDAADAADIASQKTADLFSGTEVGELVATMHRLGPGRVYAGLPNNWGGTFYVGLVPVFKYLADVDQDVVGYTLRTASLMSGPESGFDEDRSADFDLFGVRYLILPTSRTPSVPAVRVQSAGDYVLWFRPQTGYLQVVETKGNISEDRADIKANSTSFLLSSRAGAASYPTVAFAGAPAAPPTLSAGAHAPPNVGAVRHETIDLDAGRASASVQLTRRAVLLLKSSYDPGWTATVDGHVVRPYMVAPALVGVTVGRGRHTVTFTYRGPSEYPLLFAISGGSIVLLAIGEIWRRRRRGALTPPDALS